jgi:hypothetical protein
MSCVVVCMSCMDAMWRWSVDPDRERVRNERAYVYSVAAHNKCGVDQFGFIRCMQMYIAKVQLLFGYMSS